MKNINRFLTVFMLVITILVCEATTVRAEGVTEDIKDKEIKNIFCNLSLLNMEDINMEELAELEDEDIIKSICLVSRDKVVSSLYNKDGMLDENNTLLLETNYSLNKPLGILGDDSRCIRKGYQISENIAYTPIGIFNDAIVFCEIKVKDYTIEESEFSRCFSIISMRYVQIGSENLENSELEHIGIDYIGETNQY